MALRISLMTGLTRQLGNSPFFAGTYLDDTGAGDDEDFAHLMLALNY